MATIRPERLAELRAMPYEEYLSTPEWLATRKRILKRDHDTCQGCHAQQVLLHGIASSDLKIGRNHLFY